MSAQQIEDSREVGDEAELVVFTVLAIFPDIDLEYEVVECTGRVISDQDMSGLRMWVGLGLCIIPHF